MLDFYARAMIEEPSMEEIRMLFTYGHSVTNTFVTTLHEQLKRDHGRGLLWHQRAWLSFCLTGVICCAELNWEEFERASFSSWKAKALGAMFIKSRIPWEAIWWISIAFVLKLHGIESGILVGDDSDRNRSKGVKSLFGVHKTKDKKTGGYTMAQNIVMLLLVSEKITIPVGFAFFRPDPGWKNWEEQDKNLRKRGITKAKRPPKPKRDPEYPMRTDILRELIDKFTKKFSYVKISAVLFDCAYLTPCFRKQLQTILPNIQIVSQIKSSQLVFDESQKRISVSDYFKNKKAKKYEFPLRGWATVKTVEYVASRLFVKSHGVKLYIIAMRYKDEQEYRYIAATNITWRAEDVIRCYSYRWLIEVAFEDWKLYEGFGRRAMQQGADGARRGVLLSLLADHLLLSHPMQLRRSKAGQPLYTVGTLCSIIRLESLVKSVMWRLGSSGSIKLSDTQIRERILTAAMPLRESRKHLSSRKGVLEFEPSPSLTKRYARAG
jgi:hypothetical protein